MFCKISKLIVISIIDDNNGRTFKKDIFYDLEKDLRLKRSTFQHPFVV